MFDKIKTKFKDIALNIKNKSKDIVLNVKNKFKKNSGVSEESTPKSVTEELTRAYTPVTSDDANTGELPTVVFTDADKLSEADKPAEGELFVKRMREDNRAISIVTTTVKCFIAAIFIIGITLMGAVFGVATAYLDTAPELDLQLIEDQDQTSYIYDSNGEMIAIYAGLENSDWAAFDEIPLYLRQAIVAVEDARFEHHNGVDFKRTVGSFISNLTSDKVQGGSTITQQLIKNKLLSPERSYKRKIQEAYLSMQLETKYEKNQILEAYLNTIPLGGTVYGVKAAAMKYFDKDLSELTLRECACLAGITQYPYKYNPYNVYFGSSDPEETKKRIDDLDFRIDTVLVCMYEEGYITREQLDAAEEDTINVVYNQATSSVYDMPHFIEYAIQDIIDNLIVKRGLEDNDKNRAEINNELRTGGYNIYLTVDANIQNSVQQALTDYKGYPKATSSKYNVEPYTDSKGNYIVNPQSAAVVIEQSTGHIKAIVGSRTEPTALKTFNRATNSKVPIGSSIKPIAVYGPAFDLGLNAGSVIDNLPIKIEGWDSKEGYPLTSNGDYGPTTVRNAIVHSWNIVAAKVLIEHVGLDASAEYLEKLGVDPEHISKTGYGLALGGSTLTPLELTTAYACIANGGVYIEPVSFIKVTDKAGNVILSAEECQESYQVFEKSTAYMLVKALTGAVESGTGTRARISGITTAGKTGTNEGNKGMLFSGFTGYYTSAVWVGHDEYIKLKGSASSVAAPLWKNYMTAIHSGLSNKAILSGKAADWDVKEVEICSSSGKRPLSCCPTETALFAKDNVPEEHCSMHTSAITCTESGQIAGHYCPTTSVNYNGFGVVLPDDSPYFMIEKEILNTIFPNIITNEVTTCSIHTKEWWDKHNSGGNTENNTENNTQNQG